MQTDSKLRNVAIYLGAEQKRAQHCHAQHAAHWRFLLVAFTIEAIVGLICRVRYSIDFPSVLCCR